MAQSGRQAQALADLLDFFLDESVMQKVMANAANWPGGTFASASDDVFTIIVHDTDGWGSRNRANEFFTRYKKTATDHRGEGPQAYVSADGTVMPIMRVTDLVRQTWHAEFMNRRSIGVETGHTHRHVSSTGQFGATIYPASADAENIPGAKLYLIDQRSDHPREVYTCWWPTPSYRGPAESLPLGEVALFPEQQYRGWALLARWLAEVWLVPRNFPLLPYLRREKNVTSPTDATKIPPFIYNVSADQNFDAMLGELAGLQFGAGDFLAPLAANGLQHKYDAARVSANTITYAPFGLTGNNKPLNAAWLDFFKRYRGFIGHGFAGATVLGDHADCPGSTFEWHRFARMVWDWWWVPFDFDSSNPLSTTVFHRPYRVADIDTPLIEYYWETDPIPLSRHRRRIVDGVLGPTSSPDTFELTTGTPVYALANGTLVAARFPVTNTAVSLAFVLVRHEVFFQPEVVPIDPWGMVFSPDFTTPTGRIDYNVPPTSVYTLYMHLTCPEVNFDNVDPANPDWLNRVLLRAKECDLAIDWYNDPHRPDQDGNHAAGHWAIPNDVFNDPAAAWRPSVLDGWRVDQDALRPPSDPARGFLNQLRNGDVATLQPTGSTTSFPIVLGDFLGFAGTIEHLDAVGKTGVRVEVFSPTLISPDFSEVDNAQNWTIPAGLPHAPAASYASEWARSLTQVERDRLTMIGADPGLVTWWPDVVNAMAHDLVTPADARLPADGVVWHYRPLDFLDWINPITWTSEWQKYRIAGAPPSAPRVRRL